MPFGDLGTIAKRVVLWHSSTDFNKGTVDSGAEVSGSDDAAVVRLKDKADGTGNFDFTTPADYTLSNGSLVEVASGLARLKLQSGDSADFPFTTSGNYTFDSGKIEITGGVGKLKDLSPANSTFYANFSSDEDGTWGSGVLTGTLSGGATVAAGKLNLIGTGKYCSWDADLNADSQQVGAFRFLVTPNYSGTPTTSQVFLLATQAAGNTNNILQITHLNNGKIRLQIKNAVGTDVFLTDLVAWSPTASQEYEFEVDWDITSGATRLFIDGVQHGSTITSTGTRGSSIGLLRAGANAGGITPNQDFEMDDILIFSTVQHTANYTAGAAIPQEKYDSGDPTIINVTGLVFTVALDTFTETSTIPSGVGLRYHVSSDNGVTWEYWTGAAWAVTDDTFTQANTSADVETNIGTLAASGTFKFRALFSTDQISTAELDRLQVSGPTTYSTTDDLHVTTNDNIQFNPTDLVSWLTAVFTSTTPASTELRVLFSVDDRVSWLTWSGSAWVAPASATTRTDATTLTDASTNFASLTVTKPLDVRVFIRTTDTSVTPSMDNIAITSDSGINTSGEWESNQYNSTYRQLNWGKIIWVETTPVGATTIIKVRASHTLTELNASSYTTVAASGDDSGVTGQYFQVKVEFTGDGIVRPEVDELCAYFIIPNSINITP